MYLYDWHVKLWAACCCIIKWHLVSTTAEENRKKGLIIPFRIYPRTTHLSVLWFRKRYNWTVFYLFLAEYLDDRSLRQQKGVIFERIDREKKLLCAIKKMVTPLSPLSVKKKVPLTTKSANPQLCLHCRWVQYSSSVMTCSFDVIFPGEGIQRRWDLFVPVYSDQSVFKYGSQDFKFEAY